MDIKQYGDSSLRKLCVPVKDKGSQRVKDIAFQMFALLKLKNGLGLSAPQVGILERIVVIDMGYYGIKPFVMINPVMKSASSDYFYSSEGCLSFPGKYAEVRRPASTLWEYFDEKGKRKELRANGLLSAVICHENDHLNGVLFIDHLEDDKTKQDIIIDMTLKNKK